MSRRFVPVFGDRTRGNAHISRGKGGLTRNSPCPIKGHDHPVRYCKTAGGTVAGLQAHLAKVRTDAQRTLATLNQPREVAIVHDPPIQNLVRDSRLAESSAAVAGAQRKGRIEPGGDEEVAKGPEAT